MPNQIIAVRHGETEWNRLYKHQGQLDSNLTELGLKQARAVAQGLTGFKIDCFYSSDLGRAVASAAIIAEVLQMPFTTDSRLRERNLGILEGLTSAEFAQLHPAEAAEFKKRDPDYVIPGGESARQKFNRCITAVENLCSENLDQTLLLVTHGGVLISLLQHTLELPLTAPRNYSLYNASINLFTITDDRKWRLEIWGEINHLRQQHLDARDDN